jgi:hypothetical protein
LAGVEAGEGAAVEVVLAAALIAPELLEANPAAATGIVSVVPLSAVGLAGWLGVGDGFGVAGLLEAVAWMFFVAGRSTVACTARRLPVTRQAPASADAVMSKALVLRRMRSLQVMIVARQPHPRYAGETSSRCAPPRRAHRNGVIAALPRI